MRMSRVALVIYNVRSAHNVGAMLRTAEGLGVNRVYICGFSPYPELPDDERLPHIRKRAAQAIHKTALGAEAITNWTYVPSFKECLALLKSEGYTAAALEQTPGAIELGDFKATSDIALVVGNEVDGLNQEVLESTQYQLKIPMSGRKESFNVAAAAAIALYHLRYCL